MNNDRSAAQERREFFRLRFSAPLQFKAYDDHAARRGTAFGSTTNISQSGILFETQNQPPKISSILWMNLDLRTLKICQEIESRALIFNNGVLGKVVRVEEGSDKDTYDVGVCFLKRDQKESTEVQEILRQL